MMMDGQYPFTKGTFILVYLLYLAIVFLAFYFHCREKNNEFSKSPGIFFLLLFGLLGVYGYIGSDYVNYAFQIATMEKYGLENYSSNWETVYLWWIQLIDYSNTLFRVGVFGTTMLLWYFLCRSVSSKSDIIFYSSIFFLPLAINGRVFLAILVFFLGVWALSSRGLWCKILGILLMAVAFFFHKTCIMLIIPFCFVFYIPKLNISFILLVGLLAMLAGYLLSPFFIFFISNYFPVFSDYLEFDDEKHTFLGTIVFGIKYGVIILISILEIVALRNKILPPFEKILYRMLFGIVVFSLAIYSLRLNTEHIFLRAVIFAVLPMILLLPEFLLTVKNEKLMGNNIFRMATLGFFLTTNAFVYLAWKLYFIDGRYLATK